MGKVKRNAKSIDEYLSTVPEKARAALEKLRKIIRAAVPDTTEGISYGIAVFKYKGKGLVGLGATDNHCSFYLMSTSVIPAHKVELKSYDTTKGTIHFASGKPLPAALVKMLIKARIAENEDLGKKK
jgi:uncharacterized protein YdhG (YjbR/CyaY superfamily)